MKAGYASRLGTNRPKQARFGRSWLTEVIASFAAEGVERAARRMLWQLDARREVLRLFIITSRQNGYLGSARESGAVSKDHSFPGSTDHGADGLRRTASKQGWQEALRCGTQPRGELMRYDSASGQFTPYLAGLSADH